MENADQQDAIGAAMLADSRAQQMASPGAPPEEVERIKALMLQPDEVAVKPIQVVFDKRSGIGIFVGGNLMEFAAVNGPFFNGPGLPALKITNLEDFMRAVAKELIRDDEDGSTLVTRMLDTALVRAIESGCDGVDYGDVPAE